MQKLRARINKPTCWKDVLNVQYTSDFKIVNGYWDSEPSVQNLYAAATNRKTATPYTYQGMALAQETLTVDVSKILPVFVDEADRYQQTYLTQMNLAGFQGRKVDEYIESQMLGQHASWKDFGQTDLDNSGDDDTTKITVSAANIDDILRAVKRKLYANNGIEFAVERGIFFIWRPEDFELLEAFCMANGFTEADIALKNGIPVQRAFYYGGCYHYLSTQHTANHVFAGIRNIGELGILNKTFGRVKFIEDPAKTSGLGIVTRLDYGWQFSSYYAEFVIDLNVN